MSAIMDAVRDETNALQKRIDQLEQALKEVRSYAANEQAHPTDLHMTCLSLIEKVARKALDLPKPD